MELATIHFDTYRAMTLLKEKGFNKKQSEGIVEVMQQIALSGISTKQDVRDELKENTNKLKVEIQKLDAKIDKKIDSQKIWFLSAMLTQTIALVAVILSVAS